MIYFISYIFELMKQIYPSEFVLLFVLNIRILHKTLFLLKLPLLQEKPPGQKTTKFSCNTDTLESSEVVVIKMQGGVS